MTIVHRHNESKERAVIVMDDMTGAVLYVVIKRDEEILFQGEIKDVKMIHEMIDRKLFSGIVLTEIADKIDSMKLSMLYKRTMGPLIYSFTKRNYN